jgi:transcriptional regulator with XRE-family HTH domain
MDNNMDFADWLKSMMEAQNLSNSELARKSGLDKSTIGNILNRERSAGVDVCKALAKGLGMRQRDVFVIAGLLDDEEEKEDSPYLQNIIRNLRSVEDEVLALINDQIIRVLIPHGKKMLDAARKRAGEQDRDKSANGNLKQ